MNRSLRSSRSRTSSTPQQEDAMSPPKVSSEPNCSPSQPTSSTVVSPAMLRKLFHRAVHFCAASSTCYVLSDHLLIPFASTSSSVVIWPGGWGFCSLGIVLAFSACPRSASCPTCLSLRIRVPLVLERSGAMLSSPTHGLLRFPRY